MQGNTNVIPMNLADEALRHRLLSNGPVGRWQTMPGTHTHLGVDVIEFRDDGRGEMNMSSVMIGKETLAFLWRSVEPGVVECQIVYEVPELDDVGQPEANDWSRLPFAFEQQHSDTGTYWVLKQSNATGFWELNTPLIPFAINQE